MSIANVFTFAARFEALTWASGYSDACMVRRFLSISLWPLSQRCDCAGHGGVACWQSWQQFRRW